jgi:hypothetical protein
MLLVSLSGVYVGSYLAVRDPVVSFESETVECTANNLHIRIVPIHESDYRLRGEPVPDRRPSACDVYDPGYRFTAPLSRVVYAPAAWVERTYSEFTGDTNTNDCVAPSLSSDVIGTTQHCRRGPSGTPSLVVQAAVTLVQ